MVENPTRTLPAPEHSLSEKLTFAVRGRVDFRTALDLANQLDAEIRSHSLVKIAEKQNEVGLDSAFALDQAIRYAGRGRNTGMSSWPALVRFYGEIGDFEQADRFRRRIEKPYRLLVDFKLAEAVAKAGGDPRTRLDDIEHRLEEAAAKHPPGNLLHYRWLGETYHAIGQDPKPALSKALEIAEKDEGHLSSVAQSLAKVGMFKEAVDVAKKMKRASRGESYMDKTRTLYEIAKQQVKSGDLEGAIQTVGISRNRYHTTSIIVRAALFSAENGQNNETLLQEAIKRAVEIVKDIQEGKEEKIWLHDLPPIWTKIALARGLSGQEHESFFQRALVSTYAVWETDCRITDLIEIYRAKYKLGELHKEILRKSLELTDLILKHNDYAEFSECFRDLALQDIAEVAADTGDFELAREIIAKFQDDDYMKAELVAYMAAEEVGSGLTSEEVRNISEEEMIDVYRGPNQTAKDALRLLRAS